MAVSARLFDVIEREGLLERAEELGERALNRLREMADQHPGVTAVRGAGLFLGVELDVEGGRFPKAGDLVRRCLEHGLVVGAAGQSVLRLAPPLIIEPSELDRGLSLLEEALRRSSSG
jgi:4-aminobutyrate aminotransferase-like enzyme